MKPTTSPMATRKTMEDAKMVNMKNQSSVAVLAFSEWLRNKHKELRIQQGFQDWWLELPLSNVDAYIEIYRYEKEKYGNEQDVLNTPCSKCGDSETELHTNGVCGNCYQAIAKAEGRA